MAFFVHNLRQTYIDLFLIKYCSKNLKTIIKITKREIWMFWSCDGIQTFSLDLVFDLCIGRHLILFFHRNSSKTVTNCKSGHDVSVYFSRPVCFSERLVETCYGLSVMGLGLVLVVSRLVLYKTSRPQGRSASRYRQARTYQLTLEL